MGHSDIVFRKSVEDVTGEFFYSQLERLNFNEKQILAQNLPELKESLLRINDAIAHPEGFGEFAFNIKSDTGVVITKNSSDYLFKKTILPLLLERKKLILKRINELSAEEKLDAIQNLATKVDNENVRHELTEELRILREEAAKYKQEIQEISNRETEAQIRLEQQRIDGLERKSKIWLSFLQRESAASIVGAIVLLLLTFSLIIGMVFGWESQVLSNGFLVILGYFFGQSSSRNNNKDNDAGGTCG